LCTSSGISSEPARDQNAGIVDEDIETTTRFGVELSQALLPLLGVGDVQNSCDDAPTGGRDRLLQRGEARRVDVVGPDEVSGAGEFEGSGTSDPGCSAGDEDRWSGHLDRIDVTAIIGKTSSTWRETEHAERDEFDG
jgi:hypothetical protein